MFVNNTLLSIANKESQDSALRQQQLKEKNDNMKKTNDMNVIKNNKSASDLNSLEKINNKQNQRRGRDDNRSKTPPKPKRGPPAQNLDEKVVNFPSNIELSTVDLSFQEFPPLPGHNGLPKVNEKELSLDLYANENVDDNNETVNKLFNPQEDPIFTGNMELSLGSRSYFESNNNSNNNLQFDYFGNNNNNNDNNNNGVDTLNVDNSDLVTGLLLGDDDFDDVVVFKPTFSRQSMNASDPLLRSTNNSSKSVTNNMFSLESDNNFSFLSDFNTTNSNVDNNNNNNLWNSWGYSDINKNNDINLFEKKNEKKLSDLFRNDSFQDYWNDLSTSTLNNQTNANNSFINNNQVELYAPNNFLLTKSPPPPPPGFQSAGKPPGLSKSNSDLSFMARQYENN